MKVLTKIVAAVLCVFVLFETVPFRAKAATPSVIDSDLKRFTIRCANNNSDSLIALEVCEYDGLFYADIEDICLLTGYTVVTDSPKSDTHSIIMKGLRRVGISKSNGELIDNLAQKYSQRINQIEYNGKFLCEMVPLLKYLGATCSVYNGILVVAMPAFNLWEASTATFDLPALLRSIALPRVNYNVGLSLSIDMLMDMLDAINGHGLLGFDAELHKKDALYEVLRTNINEYSSVKTLDGESISKHNRLVNLLDISLLKHLINDLGLSQPAENYSVDSFDYDLIPLSIDSVANIANEVVTFLNNSEIETRMLYGFNTYEMLMNNGETVLAQNVAKSISQKTLQLEDITYSFNSASSMISYSALAYDIGIKSYQMMQLEEDTKDLFKNAFDPEVLEYAEHSPDSQWIRIGNTISSEIRNKPSIIATNAYECIKESVASDLTAGLLEEVINKFAAGQGGIYLAGVAAGWLITSALYQPLFESYSADMNAIYLYLSLEDSFFIASDIEVKCFENGFTDKTKLEWLRNSLMLFYRTLVAYCENLAISCDEFGGKRGKEAAEYFRSVADAMAGMYYITSNSNIAQIDPISTYSDDIMGEVDKEEIVTSTKPGNVPDGAVMWNGHYYMAYDSSMTWSEAKAFCEENGGYLASITSSAEQQFVSSLVSTGNKNLYWIGLYKNGDDWFWANGETYSYENWAEGEPNNVFNGTECVCEIYSRDYDGFHTGEWNDSRESGGTLSFWTLENTGIICEWDSDYCDKWMEFIDSKGWRNRSDLLETIDMEISIGALDHWFDDDGHRIEYLIVDLDNDDIPELILSEHHWDINTDLTVWKFNSESWVPSIIEWNIAIDGRIESNQWVSNTYYSREYNAVVFTIGRPVFGEVSFSYCTLVDGYLIEQYNLAYGGFYDESSFSGNGFFVTLTEEEYDEYVRELWNSLDYMIVFE